MQNKQKQTFENCQKFVKEEHDMCIFFTQILSNSTHAAHLTQVVGLTI